MLAVLAVGEQNKNNSLYSYGKNTLNKSSFYPYHSVNAIYIFTEKT